MSTGQPPAIARLLDSCYGAVTDAVSGATDADLLRSSGCAGWRAADLLVHLLADARRALVTFATPEPGPADTDDVGYWRRGIRLTDPSEPPADAHGDHVRRLSVAYSRPASIVHEWSDTSGAARRAALAMDPERLVGTQGCVLMSGDFVATLVVEATIHLLDLRVALPRARPSAPALAMTARTITSLASGAVLPNWSSEQIFAKVTGRDELTDADRVELGERAAGLPLRL